MKLEPDDRNVERTLRPRDDRAEVHPNWDVRNKGGEREPNLTVPQVEKILYGTEHRARTNMRRRIDRERPWCCKVCGLQFGTEGEAFECCAKAIMLNKPPALSDRDRARAKKLFYKGYLVKEIFDKYPMHYGLLTAYCAELRRDAVAMFPGGERGWLAYRDAQRDQRGLPKRKH